MITELLSSLGISAKVAAAAAAGAVAVGGLGVAGAAVLDDRPEPPEVPVLAEEAEDPRADGPATALEASDGRSADENEVDADDADIEAVEAADDEGRPDDVGEHGEKVSSAAQDGGGQHIADIARDNHGATASEGRSTAGAENGAEASQDRSTAGADNAPAERPETPADERPASPPEDAPPAAADQGLDRSPQRGGSDD